MTWFFKKFLSPPPVSFWTPWRVAHPERPSLKGSGQLCFKEERPSLKQSWPIAFKEGRSGWATVKGHGKETYESDRNFKKSQEISRYFKRFSKKNRSVLSFPDYLDQTFSHNLVLLRSWNHQYSDAFPDDFNNISALKIVNIRMHFQMILTRFLVWSFSEKKDSLLRNLCECSANPLRMLCECSANALRMLCECSANALRMLCGCSANALRMLCSADPCCFDSAFHFFFSNVLRSQTKARTHTPPQKYIYK